MVNLEAYFLSFGYGLCIFISFIGWGSLLQHTISFKQHIDIGQRAAWGIAAVIFLGSLLNLAGIISKETVLFLVALGVMIFLITNRYLVQSFLKKDIKGICLRAWKQDKLSFLGWMCLGGLILVTYMAWIVTIFPSYDDYAGYFVFPSKMLGQGSLGIEPYSERRLFALGGQYFLQTWFLAVLQLKNLHILDPGLGFIICSFILWHLGRRLGVPGKVISLSVILFLLLVVAHIASIELNMTSFLLGSIFVLALFCVFEERASKSFPPGIGRNILIALLISALVALKTTFLGFVLIYVILLYLVQLILSPHKKDLGVECFQIISFTVIFLLPWMIASFQSSGTMLFPFLGRGFHQPIEGFFRFQSPTPSEALSSTFKRLSDPQTAFIIIFCLLGLRNNLAINLHRLVFGGSLMVAAILTDMLMPYRDYAFPWIQAGLFIFILIAFSKTTAKPYKFLPYVALCCFLLVFSKPLIASFQMVSRLYPQMIKVGMLTAAEPLRSSQEQDSYRKAQAFMAPSETFIAHVECPFLLNYQRNKIYLVDFLIAGPNPGIPILKGPKETVGYLVSQKVRYLMYSRSLNEGLMQHPPGWMLNFPWIRSEIEFTAIFEEVLNELSKTSQKVYDDGNIFIIDMMKHL